MTKVKRSIVILALLTVVFSLTVVKAEENSKAQSAAAYANFRNVRAGSIGLNSLYRSQHPANGSKRAICANMLMQEKGIQFVLNLSDSKKSLEKYFVKNKVTQSYYYKELYDQGRVYTAHFSVEHKGSSYREKVTLCVRCMAYYGGPYLVHCEIGRDRTGFLILLLESLMGAPYTDILDDYARTYADRYCYSYKDAQKKARDHVGREFNYITGKSKKTDWSKIDLAMYAERYLRKGGMTENEITALRRNLSITYLNSNAGTAK